MTRTTDRIERIERAFATEPNALCRRLAIRKVLKAVTDEAFEDGYTEGMRDVLDAQRRDREALAGQLAGEGQ